MSTNKTQNYQLNQWVKSDQVRMEEFNADNAKIDAALAALSSGKADKSALSSLQSVVNGKASTSALNSLKSTVTSQNTALSLRNCRFVTGSYTGTGKYGSSNANSLTFPYKPVFVCVTSESVALTLSLVLGQTKDWVVLGGGGSSLAITWGARSVSWYANDTSTPSFAARHQMNDDSNYHYFAILEVE